MSLCLETHRARWLNPFCVAAAVALSLVVGFTGASRIAYADEQTNPEYTAALDRLNSLSDQYSTLASAQNDTFAQLEEVRSKISETQGQMADVQLEVEARKAELTAKKAVLADQISDDYKSGGVNLLSILVSSTSFEDAISKVYYYGVICQSEAEKIAAVNTARAELEDRQVELKKLENGLQEEESSIEELYDQQREQADAMYAQQLEAAELLSSLPKEIQTNLDEENSELIAESQAVVEAQEESKAQQDTNSDQNQQNSDNTGGNSNDSQSSDEDKKSADKAAEDNQQKNEEENKNETPAPTPTPNPDQTQGASGTQDAVVNAAYSNNGSEAKSKGWGCAGWVYCVFRDSGVYNRKPTCAAWYYNNWCFTSDRSQIQPGMVVAVSTWTGTAAGKIYGHVGIYVGNNTVRHLSAGAVRDISLDDWIKRYGTTVTPMWGWNGGIALS